MSRRIDYRAPAPHSADALAAVMLDPAYLRARLKRIGGPGAALLSHEADADGGHYRIRQGVDEAMLPSVVRSLVGGTLVIERSETLRRSGANSWAGTTDVAIPGTPASAVGTIAVVGGAAGSEFRVSAEVTVSVPFVGGRIEASVAEQVKELLAAEYAFTLEYLEKHPEEH